MAWLQALMMLAVATLGLAHAAGGARELSYRFRFHPQQSRIDVELRFQGDSDGRTVISVPQRWAGADDLDRGIERLQVVGTEAALLPSSHSDERVLRHPPNAPITLRYSLRQINSGPLHAQHFYSPLLLADYFHFVGHAGLVLPDWSGSHPIDVSLDWQGIGGETVANSFGVGSASQRVRVRLAELAHAVYLGGAVRLLRREVGGRPVFVALRDRWDFSDETFADEVSDIIAVERDFWRDHDFPHYLVSALPLDSPGTTIGFGLTNAFTVALSRQFSPAQAEGWRQVQQLLAHEHQHNWTPGRLGVKPARELRFYWFTEGFTDYYTWLLLLRAGKVDLEAYVAEVNRNLRTYYGSAALYADNDQVEREFFTDYSVQRLPYRRGELLAQRWNAEIRAASKGQQSLDDVMHALLATRGDGRRELSPILVANFLRRAGVANPSADINRHIELGEPVLPRGDELGPCVRVEWVPRVRYSLGFDLEATKANQRMTGVVADGPAGRAGVREGEPLLDGSFGVSDPEWEVHLQLLRNGGSEEVSYLPQIEEAEQMAQYRVDGEALARSPDSCYAWFGARPPQPGGTER
ncbi:M61 family metallopeptidase [Chitinimonas lacunae]|uniref:Peptidase M61 catalytic domain-containing protein n=1 Tax=Chitinimonas lacunae TaxID=1963018 RepID=A0ABV8MIR7_9NEIS